MKFRELLSASETKRSSVGLYRRRWADHI